MTWTDVNEFLKESLQLGPEYETTKLRTDMEQTKTIDDEIRLSPSIAKILLEQTPAHAYAAHSKLGKKPRAKSPSMNKGLAVDRLVFGVGPDLYLSKGKKEPELIVQATTGHDSKDPILVTDAVYKEACDVAASALAGMHERGIVITPELAQVKWYWTSEGQVMCKCIVDLWDGVRTVYDLKTAQSLDDDALTYAIEKFGYDIQAAAELEALTKISGNKNVQFKWLFVETGQVNDFRVITPSSSQIGFGTQRWLEACSIWKQCMDSGFWPGRPDAELGPSRYRTAAQANLFEQQIGGETD